MKLTSQINLLNWVAVVAISRFTLLPVTGRSQDQSELIQKLLDRIEQLEKKVDVLESNRTSSVTSTPTTDTNALRELDQKIRIIDRKNELAAEVAAEKSKTTPTLTIGAGGLQASSADTNFVFGLRGVLQVDNRTFFDDGGIQGNDGFILRRARPIFQGTVFRDFDFQFTPEFGGSTVQIVDA